MNYNTEEIKKEIENQINKEITINTVQKEKFSTIYYLTIDNTTYLCKVREQRKYKNDDELQEHLIINQKLCDMHVKIPRIYDMWFEGNTKYTIMEYIEGIQLKEYLKSKNFDNVVLEKLSKSIAQNLAHWHSIELDEENLFDAIFLTKINFTNIENKISSKTDCKYLAKRLDQLIDNKSIRETVGYTHGDLTGQNILVSPEGKFVSFVDTEIIHIDLIGLDISNIKYEAFKKYPKAYETFLARYLEILGEVPEKKRIISDNLTLYDIIYKVAHEMDGYDNRIEEDLKQLIEQYKQKNNPN